MVVPQSNKGFDEYYVPSENEDGQTVFQLAGDLHPPEGIPNDTTALLDGYISVTVLAPDMTDHERTRKLQQKNIKLTT
jgi:hypothetical protein